MKNLLELMSHKNGITEDYLYTFGLEFFAVDHCNLKCFGCSQSSPYLDTHFADIKTFKKSLETLSKYLRPNKITILGGEPTLHPEIDSIVKIARESEMFNEIHITTNGIKLMTMSTLFWEYIDAIAISKYPSNSVFLDYKIDEINDACHRHQVKLQIRDMQNFNRIILTEENSNKEVVKEIYHKCIYKFYCHTLSDNKIFRCSPVVNIEKYQKKLGHESFDNTQDYLKIEDSDHFKMDLFNYLDSKLPLKGCHFCLGSSGKSFSHRQLSKKEIEHPDNISISDSNYDYNG